MSEFRKKIIVVTGANRGIGFQAALDLASEGHKVILTGRNLEKVMVASEEIVGDVIPHQLDVTDSESISRFAQFVSSALGKIDVLVNNAGSVFEDVPEEGESNPLYPSVETFRQTLDLNLVGTYSITKALIPLFGQELRSDIVNVSSGMGAFDSLAMGNPSYRISKVGLNGLTVYLANSLQGTKINVNAVCPGWVKTELGGPNADRSPEQGVEGINWIINEEPDLNGQFIRDRSIIQF